MRRLITIPISHYCEKARWALDRARVPYVEERHVQLVHVFVVGRLGGRTTPVLVCEDGVLTESGSIVGWAARRMPPELAIEPEDPVLRAEAMALERTFDVELGPHARRWSYFQLRDQRELAEAYNLTGVPGWERALARPGFALMMRGISAALDVTPETAEASMRRVHTVFDAVGDRLADGRTHLVGDRFSRADLSFAALAAAVLLPPEFGTPLPRPDELPTAMAEGVLGLRDHPAGAFAMRLFSTERRR
jgi:glutathione S-transferase